MKLEKDVTHLLHMKPHGICKSMRFPEKLQAKKVSTQKVAVLTFTVLLDFLKLNLEMKRQFASYSFLIIRQIINLLNYQLRKTCNPNLKQYDVCV